MGRSAFGILVLTIVACSSPPPPPPAPPPSPPSPPAMGLQQAALMGNLAVIQQHIAAGSDLDGKDAYGSTPLIVAATFGRADVARALLEAGADPDIPNNDGATPLHIAAFFCRTEMVQALLDHGADRYARNNVGSTPLDAVAAPFADVEGMYDVYRRALAPLGLKLDYERISATRPRIAELLRPPAEELEAVEYAPVSRDDWPVSTPAAEGLDPALVAELYLDAAHLSNLYALLVVRHGRLIGEGYFNEGAIDRQNALQSVTKSYVSALVGVALDRGCLTSVDQKMVDFFPELAGRIEDPRKAQITIRQLLEMRAGYPWEDREPPHMERLVSSDNWHWLPHMVDFALSADPGTRFGYSNLSSHLLAVIVARACQADLAAFGQEQLFTPIGAEVGDWTRDADGYRFGSFEIRFTARDMARFGLLYLKGGEHAGKQVLPTDWVQASLQRYSEGMYDDTWRGQGDHYLGPYFRDVGYGYQWWSGRVGEHRFGFAWGHGGNLIILLPDLDMIVVTAADPQYERLGEAAWEYEGAILNLVGKFIRSLPQT